MAFVGSSRLNPTLCNTTIGGFGSLANKFSSINSTNLFSAALFVISKKPNFRDPRLKTDEMKTSRNWSSFAAPMTPCMPPLLTVIRAGIATAPRTLEIYSKSPIAVMYTPTKEPELFIPVSCTNYVDFFGPCKVKGLLLLVVHLLPLLVRVCAGTTTPFLLKSLVFAAVSERRPLYVVMRPLSKLIFQTSP